MPRAPKSSRSTVSRPSRERVGAHRRRLRAKGLRPVQIWLPDTNSEAFRKEAARQSRMVRESPGEKETLDFLAAIADWPDR